MVEGSEIQTKAKGILSYFTRHNTIANLLMIVMLALGLLATSNIRAQFFPDVIIESVSVSVSWPGAGPEDVDNAIVAVLGTALLAVEGVDSSRSTANEGTARITLEFSPGWDMARATDDVKSAVEAVNNLPEDAEEPVVRRAAWRDRVTDVMISGPVSVDQLGQFADEFTARLYGVGVTRTSVQGVEAEQIRLFVSEASLIRHDIDMRDISSAISQQTQTNPAGEVAGGSSRLRTGVENRSADDIASIVIRTNSDGSKLLVRDVAEIQVDGADSGRAYFEGDNLAVLVQVDRADLGDAISMQAQVQAAAEELQLTLPKGTTVRLINARAEQITDRLDILFKNGGMGLGLVLLLLYLFLGLRTAFWVAAGIPVAMFAAIGVMFMAGLTINMISLFALIITLGIVVDDAIVMAEHADFRARRLGEPPTEAAENAAYRMASPVFSSTITTVLAFFGLVLIGGRFGSLISDIPFTVIAVLLASLAECFLILPNHMRHAISSTLKRHWYDLPSRLFNAGFRWMRDVLFKRAMGVVIKLRYPVVAAMLLILASVSAMFIRGDVTWRFFNSPEQGTISGNIAMLPSATRVDTIEMVQEVQRAVKAVSDRYEVDHGRSPVTHVLAQVGGTTGRGLSGAASKEPDQLGAINIGLIDADLRPYSSFAFLGDVQEEVRSLPLLETLSFRRFGFGPGGDSLDVSLYGADATTLKAASEFLKARLSRYPAVSALEDNLAYDKTELVLQLTPLGQSLGFNIETLGGELRDRLNGIEAASFPDGVRSSTVTVEMFADELTADFLGRTRIRTPAGEYVLLSDIVTVEETLGFSTVRRENGLRLIKVSGDISEDDPVVASEITKSLEEEILPDLATRFGISWNLGGLAEQENDFLYDALISFTLCLLGIYLTLAWIFASWMRPIVVMAIIPFGLVGTIWGHYTWDVPLSMFTVIGLIGMSGIIINDSIVLISTIQEYARNRGLVPAVIDAASDRLRPLMLTTLTTVLGLAPLLFETSQQAQFLKPTVITLCYGLGFGFFVVLLVVPSLVVMQQDAARIWMSLQRAIFGHGIPRALRVGMVLIVAVVMAMVALTVGNWVVSGTHIAALQPIADRFPMIGGAALSMVILLLGVVAVLVVTTPFLARAGRVTQKNFDGESL